MVAGERPCVSVKSFVNSPKRKPDATSGAPKRRSRGMAMRHAVMRRGTTSHTFRRDCDVRRSYNWCRRLCARPGSALRQTQSRRLAANRSSRALQRLTNAPLTSYLTPSCSGVSPAQDLIVRDINLSSDGRLTVAFVVSPSGRGVIVPQPGRPESDRRADRRRSARSARRGRSEATCGRSSARTRAGSPTWMRVKPSAGGVVGHGPAPPCKSERRRPGGPLSACQIPPSDPGFSLNDVTERR